MLPDNVAAYVHQFARSEAYLAHPDEAENMCGVITCEFTNHMKIIGLISNMKWARCFRALDITRPHREGILSNYHTFPVWDDIAIDFTARQFWLEAPFPLITPLSTYRSQFERVDVYRVDQLTYPEGGRPRRIPT